MRNHGIWNLEVSCFWTNPYGYIYICMVSLHLCLFFKGGLCMLFRFFWIRLRILFGFLLFCCPCCSPSLLFYFSAFLFFGFFALLLCFSASPFFFLFLLSVFSCFSAVLAFSFLLLCFVRFLLFLLLCFCAFLRLLVFFFSLFSPVCILNETLDETQRPPKEIPIRNPT